MFPVDDYHRSKPSTYGHHSWVVSCAELALHAPRKEVTHKSSGKVEDRHALNAQLWWFGHEAEQEELEGGNGVLEETNWEEERSEKAPYLKILLDFIGVHASEMIQLSEVGAQENKRIQLVFAVNSGWD